MPKIIFKKPISVLFLHEQTQSWSKAEYRQLASRCPEWQKDLALASAWVENEVLHLSEDLLPTQSSNILLLNPSKSAEYLPSHSGRRQLNHFLYLRAEAKSQFWLELQDDYYPLFGSPKRESFAIMPLDPHKSVEIWLNAKIWHTLAGFRRLNEYLEFNYFLANWGIFSEAEIISKPSTQTVELIADKSIDLRMILY
jgi:hypothetical protein